MPLVLQTDKSTYVGKSFIVHISAARNTNDFLIEISNVFTPTFHNSCNFDIKGCRKTLISIWGEDDLGISNDNMKECYFMHNQGCKL